MIMPFKAHTINLELMSFHLKQNQRLSESLLLRSSTRSTSFLPVDTIDGLTTAESVSEWRELGPSSRFLSHIGLSFSS